MFRFKFFVAVAAAMLAAPLSHASVSFTENFSSDPFTPAGNWSYGVGNNSLSQFTWTGSALDVHLDSTLPTVRVQRPLGVTVTDTDDFTLKTRFSFSVSAAPTNTSMQIAFGLVNSLQTGGNRTGSPGVFTDDNTFHTVEFNYFPQISTFSSPPTGPNLTPAVFGAHKTGNDAFGNFAAYFFSEADLHNNTTGIKELPQNVTLEAALSYSAASKLLTLAMSRVNADNSLTLLDTEVPPMSLISLPLFGTYDTNFPFSVDSLAIMAYKDGFTDPNDSSLKADLQFKQFDFFTPVPEPSTLALVAIGGVGALAFGRHSRS